MNEQRIFLGVENSANGRRWIHALDRRAEDSALRMVQREGIPELVARVLAARGVAADGAASFLVPTLRESMPDPSLLTDMDLAAARIADAIERNETIAIFGDYDVDGAASAALLGRYLQAFGLEPHIRIPDRLREGYGPNPLAMRELVHAGAQLIVTVDCGTGSFEALEAARDAGVDLIVLDHHQTGALLPPALAIVNPNRQDDLSGQGHLCAAGVVFLTLVAVSRELRRRGRPSQSLPNLLDDLDLVSLATICDVVPLKGFNRALVRQGLAVMRRLENVGLRALAKITGLSGPIDVYHLGFILGPRINAGGRIGESHLGSLLLTTRDDFDAEALAQQLHLLNAERQAIEKDMLADAEREVSEELGAGEGPSVLIVGQQVWHPGVVGLIASRLKERFSRPAFAIAFDATGRGSGSGRSIPGFDIGTLVRGAVEDGILIKGGGHAMAAGLTIDRTRLADFRAYVEERSMKTVPALMRADALSIDGAVSAGALSVDMMQRLEQAGPFGAGHPNPTFALPRHRLVSVATVGTGGHVRATLKSADGSTASAIAFRAENSPLGTMLLGNRDQLIHAAGNLAVDRYQGRERVSFRLLDAAHARS